MRVVITGTVALNGGDAASLTRLGRDTVREMRYLLLGNRHESP